MSLLQPVADALLLGRSYAESQAIDFLHQFKYPATTMLRAHYMRAVVQGQVQNGAVEGFSLVNNYLDSGKVEIVHDDDRRHYLLKARCALRFESSAQGNLLDQLQEPRHAGLGPLKLLLYLFRGDELELATVPVEIMKRNRRKVFQLLGEVVEVGVWSSASIPGMEPFDQGLGDDFGDMSNDVEIHRDETQ